MATRTGIMALDDMVDDKQLVGLSVVASKATNSTRFLCLSLEDSHPVHTRRLFKSVTRSKGLATAHEVP